MLILGTLFTETIALVSVCCYNIRRSRCVKCKICGIEIEREVMSDEAMEQDKLTIPSAI